MTSQPTRLLLGLITATAFLLFAWLYGTGRPGPAAVALVVYVTLTALAHLTRTRR